MWIFSFMPARGGGVGVPHCARNGDGGWVVGGGGVAAGRVVGGGVELDGLEPQPTKVSTGTIPNSRLTRMRDSVFFKFFMFMMSIALRALADQDDGPGRGE
jgi:hypothetical protein